MRRKILIITPHYPPSNLASVHRSRLFAQHLPQFGWDPIILTVAEQNYEEALDWRLHSLLPKDQRIIKVNALPLTKPRLIGDIGLRAFFQLRKRALQIIRQEKIDFIYIPIPSFYVSLLGPYLRRKTGVKYGIDYIDPWVHEFPGSERRFSRHWWSTKLAHWLEPKAVRRVSLITGVARAYFEGVLERNKELNENCLFGAMPYGGEKDDHQKVRGLKLAPYLFQKNGKKKFIYAGAMLPKAFLPLDAMFKAMATDKTLYNNIEFYFIGTGKTPDDEYGYSVRPLAEKYGLWSSAVFELPKRISYLDVLMHLEAADAVFVLGSTEKHYTPSKIYQAVLSRKPILAVLHQDSTAVKILYSTGAAQVLTFSGEEQVGRITAEFNKFFENFQTFCEKFCPDSISQSVLEPYSANAITKQLANLLDKLQ